MTGDKGLILLIEDEPQMRRFLKVTLQSHGYILIETSTGQEGLTQATAHNPDVILLDLGLPDLDGLDVIRELRDYGPELPIIVLSARSGSHDKVAALDLGAVDYVTKPFDMNELIARLRQPFQPDNFHWRRGRRFLQQLAAIVEHGPDFAVHVPHDKVVARVERAVLHQDRPHRTASPIQFRFEHYSARRASRSRF